MQLLHETGEHHRLEMAADQHPRLFSSGAVTVWDTPLSARPAASVAAALPTA